jgi:CubicO group peptidase (beta-lactamase class C family)
MIPRLSAALLALIALSPAVQAQETFEAVDQLAADFVGDTTPGLGVLVMSQGEVVHIAGYGFADLARKTPVTVDSIFDLASVSKEMTALAVRAQIEAGLYTPETPIGDILPQLADIDSPRPLTVGDLIHHLSGLTDYLSWDGYSSKTSTFEIVDWLGKQDLDHSPGQQFDYSNSGYVTLGAVAGAIEGVDTLAAVLQTRIWDIAGMTDTGLPEPVDARRRVTGYVGTGGNFEPAYDPTVTEGDGNVFTTLKDMAKYEAGLSQGAYLKDTAALFANGAYDNGNPIADEDGLGYGYGWQLNDTHALHTGSWTGTSTLYTRNLETGVTVVLLANGEAAELWELAEQIEAAVE